MCTHTKPIQPRCECYVISVSFGEQFLFNHRNNTYFYSTQRDGDCLGTVLGIMYIFKSLSCNLRSFKLLGNVKFPIDFEFECRF